MSDTMKITLGILLPFVGTSLGSAMVYLLRGEMSDKLQKALSGFAAGVMISASFFSLLIPAMNMAEGKSLPVWLPASVGFLCGIAFLLLLDIVIPHLHAEDGTEEGPKTNLKKTTMLVLAVTLHNFPEGMATGVLFAGFLSGQAGITFAGAMALSIGIAVQNFPEGAIISMPMATLGASRSKSFLYGVLSGLVEPLGALLTIFLTSLISPILPFILSFAAGAMMYVVIEELIPSSQSGEHSNIATIAASLGFVLMLILDVALG